MTIGANQSGCWKQATGQPQAQVDLAGLLDLPLGTSVPEKVAVALEDLELRI